MPFIDPKVSDNFRLSEFACQGERAGGCDCHSTGALVDERLVRIVQTVREITGPTTVTSAVRCDRHNARRGGHPRSFHRIGFAADITNATLRDDLEQWAHRIGEIAADVLGPGKGNVIWYKYRGFIHIDVGHRVGGGGIVRVNTSRS